MKDPIVDAMSPDERKRQFVPWPADTVAAGRPMAWLTAASQRHLQRAGGAETVARLAGPGDTMLEYQGGYTFQACNAPQVGDHSQSLPLHAYRGLAHALKPARAVYEASIFVAPMDDHACQDLTPEAAALRFSQRWLERFDRGRHCLDRHRHRHCRRNGHRHSIAAQKIGWIHPPVIRRSTHSMRW